MTDKELLELLRKEPQKGLEAVILQYSAYVMKIAGTKLGTVCSREDIEEAASDIFLKFFYAGMKSGFSFDSVRGSLSLIAGRHCVDVFRQKCRQPNDIPLDEIIDIAAADGLDGSDGSEVSEISELLAQAIHSLGELDESIFIRKFFFGQKTADIARELHLKPNTVDKRVSRGLKKLRKILGEREA